ncbi:hypothetical protein Tco_1230006 [Tanacetum coccineum]
MGLGSPSGPQGKIPLSLPPEAEAPDLRLERVYCLTNRGRVGRLMGLSAWLDDEERRQGIENVGTGVGILGMPQDSRSRIFTASRYGLVGSDLAYVGRDDSPGRSSMDGGGGGLCFSRGLGLLDRIERNQAKLQFRVLSSAHHRAEFVSNADGQAEESETARDQRLGSSITRCFLGDADSHL